MASFTGSTRLSSFRNFSFVHMVTSRRNPPRITTNPGSATYKGLSQGSKICGSTGSGALAAQPYGFQTRFEDAAGTNPEELTAAAQARCLTMALSFKLAEAGHEDGRIVGRAEVTSKKG